MPVFQDIWKLDTDAGRFFNGQEEQQRAHVCVIGSESKTKLFSGGWAVGQTIRLNGVLFTIIGVLSPKMQEGEDSDRNRQIYVPFSTMSDLADTKYLGGIWFNYQGNYELDGTEYAQRHWARRITSGLRIIAQSTWRT